MPTCLVVQHVAPESAFSLDEALLAAGVTVDTRRLFDGDDIPLDTAGFDGVVVMGGPMSVNSTEGFPSRDAEVSLLADALRVGIPTLGVCLGAQLLAVAAGRAGATDPAAPNAGLDRAVAGALSAITALQLNAASTLGAHPEGLAFTLPVALPGGFAQAHVRVDRDAPNGRKIPLDGDNFHIAFVLETRHLGTVAIDVVTVGRTVTLSVKTEAVVAQRVFASALSRLSARLESLRYRVAKADAAVAPPAAAEASSTRPVAGPAPDAVRLVDVDA